MYLQRQREQLERGMSLNHHRPMRGSELSGETCSSRDVFVRERIKLHGLAVDATSLRSSERGSLRTLPSGSDTRRQSG